MHGEPAHVRDPEARGVPFPPVTTQWIAAESVDPGATGLRLPPFWAGAREAGEVLETEADANLETEFLEPVALEIEPEPLPWEAMPQVEELTAIPPDPEFVDEAATLEVMELELPAEEEEEEKEEVDDATEELVVPIGDLVEESDWSPTMAAVEEEEILEEPVTAAPTAAALEPAAGDLVDGPLPEEQPWEAFGRALQEAISWGDLPPQEPEAPEFWSAPEETEEEPAAQPWEQGHVAESAPATIVPPEAAMPEHEESSAAADPFVQDVAEHLQSLVDRLRAQGMRALGDAIVEGDRLEASLALFLAGYRAGRGE